MGVIMEIDWNEFADWTATKTGSVDFNSSSNCAIAQYLSHKFPESSVWVGFKIVSVPDHGNFSIPNDISNYIRDYVDKLSDGMGNPTIIDWSQVATDLKEMGYGSH